MDKSSFLMYLDYEEQFTLLSDAEIGQLMRAIMKYEKTRELSELDGMVKMAFSFIKTQLDRDREKYESKCEKNKLNGKRGGRPKKENLKTINGEEIPEGEVNGGHFLYLIYDNINNQYKIGETKDLQQRRYDIKRPTNNLIVIDYYLGTMLECQKYEKEILFDYQEYSVGGDWFELPEEKVDEILKKYFSNKANGFLNNRMVPKKPDNDDEDDNENDNKKESKRKKFIPPSLDDVKKYILEKKITNVNAKGFYDYFTEGKWKDSNGKEVRNWKQKILTWNGFRGSTESKKEEQPKKQYQNYQQRNYENLDAIIDEIGE